MNSNASTDTIGASPRLPAATSPVARLPLSTRSRAGEAPSTRSRFPTPTSHRARSANAGAESRRSQRAWADASRGLSPAADGAAVLDRRLRDTAGRTARCRIAEGWLAASLLSRRSWFSLGFVRVDDYSRERLGLGARILEEEARVVRCLAGLPRITQAFLDGTVPWTAVRLVAGVATPGDEQEWIAKAAGLNTRSLAALVRAKEAAGAEEGDDAAAAKAAMAAKVAQASGRSDAVVAGDPAGYGPDRERPFLEDDGNDPARRWSVRLSRGGRRLWRAARELAERTAGSALTPAQVLEHVAAEASGSVPARGPESAEQRTSPSLSSPSLLSLPSSLPKRSGNPESATLAPAEVGATDAKTAAPSLLELLHAEIERAAADPRASRRLPFLTPAMAEEVMESDPLLAAFYAEMLANGGVIPSAGPGTAQDAGLPPGTDPDWFDEALRMIGRTEGFAWLAALRPVPERGSVPPMEWLEAEFAAREAAEPHTLDARLREVRRAAQALDSELAGLLREAADGRIHHRFGLSSFEDYVENRIGIGARTAWSLLSMARATVRCPPLAEAWRSGRVSTMAARILMPVLGAAHAAAWIERASLVTLRRLEAEVEWTLDRRDAGQGAADGLAPPAVDLDLLSTLLAAATDEELQMRAQGSEATVGFETADDSRAGVQVEFFAPESVIALAEETIAALRRGGESRGRAFERMVALALLEWSSVPRHRDPVFDRDGWRCAVPGCRSRRNLHDHHVVFRSHGGDNARDNRVTVCAAHHLHGLHRGRITARGTAPHGIVWELGCRFGEEDPLMRLLGDRHLDGGPAVR